MAELIGLVATIIGLGVAAQVLAAWGAGGGIVGPAAQVTERQRADEAITAQV